MPFDAFPRLLALLALGATLLGAPPRASAQPRARDIDPLTVALANAPVSTTTRRAAHQVATARAVGGFHFGVTGAPTTPILGMRALLRLPAAELTPVLLAILEHGTSAARVYVLAALWAVDHAVFERELARWRGSHDPIPVLQDGCVQFNERVAMSELLESHDRRVVRLTGPGDTAGIRRARFNFPPYDVVGGGLWVRLRWQ